MSSQLDPDDGRDTATPHAPKSADLNEENSNPPKESSRQADEHRTVTAEPQLPVARLLVTRAYSWMRGQRRDDP